MSTRFTVANALIFHLSYLAGIHNPLVGNAAHGKYMQRN